MRLIWLILIILLSLILFGMGDPPVVRPLAAPTVEINGNPGVILDASQYWGDFDGWTPEASHLQAAEDAVLAAPSGDREPQIDGYRQYIGIIEGGQRKIVVNSMCIEFDGWTEGFIEVADGGACFWQAIYNVETGELESLIVNGEA